jgi:signal transduction histidine kinase
MSDDEALARLNQLAAVGELAAGVVHETRNILSGILGFAQLARERSTSHDVERIERDAQRCVTLLDEFLTMSRRDDDAGTIALDELLEHVVASASRAFALERVALHTQLDPDLPRLHARRGELKQTLYNLLVNALHATEAGGEVVICATATHGAVEIAVVDTGIGVPAELHDKIFEPFFTTRSAGTGLGLALCRTMVERDGGTLTLDRDYRGGARFVVTLPRAERVK